MSKQVKHRLYVAETRIWERRNIGENSEYGRLNPSDQTLGADLHSFLTRLTNCPEKHSVKEVRNQDSLHMYVSRIRLTGWYTRYKNSASAIST